MSPEFIELLKQAVKQFETQEECATALGISRGRFNAALNNKTDYAFDIINCLHLADLLNEAPSRVLRAGGHTEIVELLERLYGVSPITPAQTHYLAHLMRLPLARRRAICKMVQALADEVTPTTKKR